MLIACKAGDSLGTVCANLAKPHECKRKLPCCQILQHDLSHDTGYRAVLTQLDILTVDYLHLECLRTP